MDMWTFILAGLLLFTLGSALEDAGVYVNGTYSQGKFHKRILPPSTFVCTEQTSSSVEWFRINMRELILKDFEKGNNGRNATLLLGTPALQLLMVADVEFSNSGYCKLLPKAYHNYSMNGKHAQAWVYPKVEYFAVKLNDTGRATIKKGWNYMKNLLTNRFPDIQPTDLKRLLVEVTASGEVYLGAVPKFSAREDNQETENSQGISSWLSVGKQPIKVG